MQKIDRQALADKASQLLSNNTVSCVLGWKRGDFDYDVTPAVFRSKYELSSFVWNDFCSANLSKQLVSETKKHDGRILVFLKPCDTYSFNQLITEHRIERDKVYVVAVPCDGMLSTKKIHEKADGISAVSCTGDSVVISTLYDGELTFDHSLLMPERCINCKSKKAVAYDETLGEMGTITENSRFKAVEEIEKLSPDERFLFWQGELSRCIRCNACRDVCPACTCEKCVFDNPSSGLENKAPSDSFEEKMFHIIRAFHVAGRCTDCGECSRVCPQNIPLHLLNRKLIKDIDTYYGTYQAGAEVGSRSPLVDYRPDDLEPCERSDFNA